MHLRFNLDHAYIRLNLISKNLRIGFFHLGKVKTRGADFWSTNQVIEKDVYLFPNGQVPISVLNLYVKGISLPFLVTARPYTRKGIFSTPFPRFLYEHLTVEDLQEHLENGGTVNTQGDCQDN